MLQLSSIQIEELRTLMRRGEQSYLRTRATALWNLSRGRTQREVSDFMGVSGTSLRAWAKRYCQHRL